MGYTYGYSSLRELKDYVLRDRSDGYEVLDSASTNYGRNLWVLYKHPEGKNFIALYLCSSYRGEYGYKDCSESMGPLEVDCPLRFLDAAPVPSSPYAAEWREKVRTHHTNRRVKRAQKFQVGQEVKIYGKLYRIVDTVRRSYRVQRLSDGAVYRCGPSKMEAV